MTKVTREHDLDKTQVSQKLPLLLQGRDWSDSNADIFNFVETYEGDEVAQWYESDDGQAVRKCYTYACERGYGLKSVFPHKVFTCNLCKAKEDQAKQLGIEMEQFNLDLNERIKRLALAMNKSKDLPNDCKVRKARAIKHIGYSHEILIDSGNAHWKDLVKFVNSVSIRFNLKQTDVTSSYFEGVMRYRVVMKDINPLKDLFDKGGE